MFKNTFKYAFLQYLIISQLRLLRMLVYDIKKGINATKQERVLDYSSKSNLVEFTNQFVKSIKSIGHRLESTSIVANQMEEGGIYKVSKDTRLFDFFYSPVRAKLSVSVSLERFINNFFRCFYSQESFLKKCFIKPLKFIIYKADIYKFHPILFCPLSFFWKLFTAV